MAFEVLDGLIRNDNLETRYSAKDFANPDSLDSQDPNQRAWVILNAGYVQAIVFAEYPAFHEQDALDAAVDANKLDGLMCNESDLKDYQVGTDSEGNPEYEGIINLGNAGEPFASESLDIWQIPARLFAEDTDLMTFNRVHARVEQWRDEAEREYKATPLESDEWSPKYRALDSLEDTLKLMYFAQHR